MAERSNTAAGPATLAVLALLTAGAPLSTDMYLPGLPQLVSSLNASSSSAQLSLSAFLIGLVAGQLMLGPISDAVGRRRVLLAGSVFFVLFSLLCAVAPTIQLLIVLRLCEGLASAASVVVSRAVVADLYRGREAARAFSLLAAVIGAASILAPVLGGLIASVTSWRGVFFFLSVVGFCQIIGILRSVPETAPENRLAYRSSILIILRNRAIIGYVLALSCSGAGILVYAAGSSFIFHNSFGLSTAFISLIYGVNAAGGLMGSVLFGALSHRITPRVAIVASSVVALGATGMLWILLLLGVHLLVVTWFCLFLLVAAFGMFLPALTTIAQRLGRDAPGATSALLSGQFLIGGLLAPLSGLLGAEKGGPVAGTITLCLAASAAALFALARPGRREEHLLRA
ncbi:multidrug effflux MFS transporter [Amycolatopsis acidicola]|uniref:Multidrug effflux MFS transporter n=1 Tax=Amycolatopsis acidicola TaxID=2596893 RepID=A0A5N0VJN5_9PSEU|nr:Bcr/CflA family efflux MFS transporter [Amycolatopsis acidicola]KAA9164942.1 multidrug effflux MFS transporter [Amycolatopsis acidicola]